MTTARRQAPDLALFREAQISLPHTRPRTVLVASAATAPARLAALHAQTLIAHQRRLIHHRTSHRENWLNRQ